MDIKLGVIGAGNMAGAILGGILRQQLLPVNNISVSNRHPEKLERYRSQGLYTTTDNCAVVQRSDIIILAVKPQMFEEVIPALVPYVKGKCVVSIAPGFSVAYLSSLLPGSYVVRAMPNTPLLLGKGVTAVVEAPQIPAELFRAVTDIFSAAGAVTVIPEAQMNAVIAVSGSSPAYFFRMADAMVNGATAQGMAPEEALHLTALTMEGTARMLLETGKTAEELTRQVCSPGGTTLAALSAFDDYRFNEIVAEAMARCANRADELGK